MRSGVRYVQDTNAICAVVLFSGDFVGRLVIPERSDEKGDAGSLLCEIKMYTVMCDMLIEIIYGWLIDYVHTCLRRKAKEKI